MSQLIFLNHTARALLQLPQTLRGSLFGRVSDLFREFASHRKVSAERVSARLFAIDVPSPSGTSITIAFTTTAHALVVMEVMKRHKMRLPILESRAHTLATLNLSQIGLTITSQPDEIQVPAMLEQAVELYSQETAPELILAVDSEEARFEVLQRLTQTTTRRWASSDARQNFKDVLDSAVHDVQLIERGGQEFLVVERSRLPAIMKRPNAVEMHRFFFEESEPTEPFPQIASRRRARLNLSSDEADIIAQ